MKKVLSILIVLILTQVASIALAAQSRSSVVTLTVDLSAQAPGENARLWIPYPVSDAQQVVSDTKVAGDFASSGVYTDRRFGPLDGEVKKLAESITAKKKTVLEKARAIYDWTVENMYRNPDTLGCGKGDVCLLLKNPGGKCTDISSVYIARGRDLVLNPPQAGQPLNTFGYPYAEVGGKAVDFYNPQAFTYSYAFKEK